MSKCIGTIDQGTTSSRFIIFNEGGAILSSSQLEHKQIFPEPGWVEHDPMEIISNVKETIIEAIEACDSLDLSIPLPVGITNQRETVVAWNRQTGRPYYNAIVWQDMRSKDLLDAKLGIEYKDGVYQKTGLIPAPYFSASKISWLLTEVPEIRADIPTGNVAIGTIDSWILWNLSGANVQAPFITDVSNASRYMLMDIAALKWDSIMLRLFDVPQEILPKIVPSIPKEKFGTGKIQTRRGEALLEFCGILGDQQAALFGQSCFAVGESKCTYGTGGFFLMNIGTTPLFSKSGILTTVAYQKEGEEAMYAFEGSIAVAGSLVQWIRDNLGIIKKAPEVDQLAMQVKDCGGVYFVPAFSGLFAPYWRPRARGVICGLTGYARKEHLCRAVLESTAFQIHDLVRAIEEDCHFKMKEMRVDGGMTVSDLLMQIQSDFLNIPIIRPEIIETTALGATYAAGLSSGIWNDYEELKIQWKENKRWNPLMKAKEREAKIIEWKKAIERSFGWVQ